MFRVASYQAVLRILLVSVGLGVGLLVCGAGAQAQQDQPAQADQKSHDSPANDSPATDSPAKDSPAKDTASAAQPQSAADAVDPLKRPATEKQRKKNQPDLKFELSKPYKTWLEADVVYIITDEERAAFKQLSNDEERDNFIE